MVYLNLMISLPVRVVCPECRLDLKVAKQGPAPNAVTVKCPGCGVSVELIQAEPPRVSTPGLPGQKWQPPAPKT